MITKEFTPVSSQETASILNPRVLGTLGLLASPMLFIEGLYMGFQNHGTDQVVGVLEVIYTTGWLASIAGLYLTQATGKGKGGKVILGIQFLGVLLAGLWSAYHIVVLNPDVNHPFYIMTDLAWPLSHMFMLVTGIATLVAKTWKGWARFTPLLPGLVLPSAILTNVANIETAMAIVFGVGTMVAFALLGYAVRNAGPDTSNA